MKRLLSILLSITVAVASSFAQSQTKDMRQWTELQNSIIMELNRSYVDSLPVDRVMRARVDAMLAELDPYTIYVPQEENEDMLMLMSKTYGGIGAIITKRKEENAPARVEKPKIAQERAKERKLKFSYKEQREFETIDDDIAGLEEKIELLDKQMELNATNTGVFRVQ